MISFLAIALLLAAVSAPGANCQDTGKDSQSENDDQILLTVTVKDKSGSPGVNYLTKDDFAVYADKKPVEIAHFDRDDVPVSIGILFDVSGSVKNFGKDPLSLLKSLLSLFIKKGRVGNEYFIYKFAEQSELICDWTRDASAAREALTQSPAGIPKGSTVFYDTCLLAIEKLQNGSHSRKVLFMITDGEDTGSTKITYAQLRQLLKESDAIVYSISLSDVYHDAMAGPARSIMEEISDISGGVAYFPRDGKQLSWAMDQITSELRCQYTIGFKPPDTSRDEKWHKIQVKMTETKNNGAKKRLKIRAREGYTLKPEDQPAKQEKE